jgi:hypothetical protein
VLVSLENKAEFLEGLAETDSRLELSEGQIKRAGLTVSGNLLTGEMRSVVNVEDVAAFQQKNKSAKVE